MLMLSRTNARSSRPLRSPPSGPTVWALWRQQPRLFCASTGLTHLPRLALDPQDQVQARAQDLLHQLQVEVARVAHLEAPLQDLDPPALDRVAPAQRAAARQTPQAVAPLARAQVQLAQVPAPVPAQAQAQVPALAQAQRAAAPPALAQALDRVALVRAPQAQDQVHHQAQAAVF